MKIDTPEAVERLGRCAAPLETPHRRIVTELPAPQTRSVLEAGRTLFPAVNGYQPPIVWERAEGYQVEDAAGNTWIDFTSTAVLTNAGHGHPAVRQAVSEHAATGLLAQFSFPSRPRVELARRLLALCPPQMEKVYFWTTGSEAIESALRLARAWGLEQQAGKDHVLTHAGDFHGVTLGATQLSGESAAKEWLGSPDSRIHHLPFPGPPETCVDGDAAFAATMDELEARGVAGPKVAAVVLETLQGWGALAYPVRYVQRMREWADRHQVLLIFDEIQTGFGRTGRMFAHEQYGVAADLICLGKGLSGSLPIAAVVGPARVLDVLPPGAVTTTHAGHPLSCAAALANLDVLERENLADEAARKGRLVEAALEELAARFPRHIDRISGQGLLWALHTRHPESAQPDPELAGLWTWSTVCQGVMVFRTMRPSLKICPPLTIPDDALLEGIAAVGDALQTVIRHVPAYAVA